MSCTPFGAWPDAAMTMSRGMPTEVHRGNRPAPEVMRPHVLDLGRGDGKEPRLPHGAYRLAPRPVNTALDKFLTLDFFGAFIEWGCH